jgi:hypothetical protein
MADDRIELWYGDIRDEALESDGFGDILSFFTAEEIAYVTKFVFMEDRKRSFLGRLLTKALVAHSFPKAVMYSIQRSAEVRVIILELNA